MKKIIAIVSIAVAGAGVLSASFLYRGTPSPTPQHSSAYVYHAKSPSIYGDGIVAGAKNPDFLYRG